MSKVKRFIIRQITEISKGDFYILTRKFFRLISYSALFLPIFFVLILIRIIRPFFLVRIGILFGTRIGHFSSNTELYLCEKDARINIPNRYYYDTLAITKPVCNKYLEKMWRRVIPNIWPIWLIEPMIRINGFLPFGAVHQIGSPAQHDRDIYNLFEKTSIHLKFTDQEEVEGQLSLRVMGLPSKAPFVCLTVRDNAYLKTLYPEFDTSYHNYRDCNVHNYVLAAEALANLGYYVIRMGVIVKEPMISNNTKIIDYATNGMRTDFMDIYLGAKCSFCITNGTGFDALPIIFRRPIVQVNAVPLGYMDTWCKNSILLSKHHIDEESGCELTLREIFSSGVGYALHAHEFKNANIQLVENSPDEIRDAVIEMALRLDESWITDQGDDALQHGFLDIFLANTLDSNGKRLHGKIIARYSASYLRNNSWWLK
jgi:putative glycosyltransferase (TIGR04372 family)